MALPHFSAVVAFAFSVSIVFALTTKETPRERLQYGVWVFLGFLAVGVVVGWIMFPFPS